MQNQSELRSHGNTNGLVKWKARRKPTQKTKKGYMMKKLAFVLIWAVVMVFGFNVYSQQACYAMELDIPEFGFLVPYVAANDNSVNTLIKVTNIAKHGNDDCGVDIVCGIDKDVAFTIFDKEGDYIIDSRFTLTPGEVYTIDAARSLEKILNGNGHHFGPKKYKGPYFVVIAEAAPPAFAVPKELSVKAVLLTKQSNRQAATSLPVLPLSMQEVQYGEKYITGVELNSTYTHGIHAGDEVLLPFDMGTGGTKLLMWTDISGPFGIVVAIWNTEESVYTAPVNIPNGELLHEIDLSNLVPSDFREGYVSIWSFYDQELDDLEDIQYIAFSLLNSSKNNLPYSVLPTHWVSTGY